ncbi:hypothetical protein BDK51DRAFT_21634 [Blyttiomyces helicus]|uniref:Large-conductance mechanosensitive channel n=1 Tax=Blyttiomyces helicus TaxID=388810 RepID=A0A4P9WBT4_9FUNG|nr:hypothetical protein BDK51DRAFT_21634 [Blyttiomyces helicus]|eukprot:RKO88628.1 hypothetical protein BDK51DRAFT_21634 [Blyttiomyces helicus]
MEEGFYLIQKSETKIVSIWHSFRQFIDHSNIIELASGVVIAGAFSSAVCSFVTDLLTPLLGFILPSTLPEFFLVIRNGPKFPYKSKEAAKSDGAITWNYGNFLEVVASFLFI